MAFTTGVMCTCSFIPVVLESRRLHTGNQHSFLLWQSVDCGSHFKSLLSQEWFEIIFSNKLQLTSKVCPKVSELSTLGNVSIIMWTKATAKMHIDHEHNNSPVTCFSVNHLYLRDTNNQHWIMHWSCHGHTAFPVSFPLDLQGPIGQ